MVRLLGQPMPDGVDYITPSLAKKPTTPSVAEYRRPSWFSFAGQSKAEYRVLPVDWASTNSPSDTNNFPEAESSVLESASGTFKVRGDGAGHWGPLKMGRNGVMSGLVVTGSLEQPNAAPNGGVVENTVTFPAGRFTVPPVVIAVGSNGRISARAVQVTSTSFIARSWNFTSSNAGANTFTWIALDGS